MANSVSFTVPLVPPSCNHYRVRLLSRDSRGRAGSYETSDAKAFKHAIRIFARGESAYAGVTRAGLKTLKYQVEAKVFFGKGQRGDGDNLWKCLADGLKDAWVIHSDAAISDWIMRVRRDWENPRTEITVTRL